MLPLLLLLLAGECEMARFLAVLRQEAEVRGKVMKATERSGSSTTDVWLIGSTRVHHHKGVIRSEVLPQGELSPDIAPYIDHFEIDATAGKFAHRVPGLYRFVWGLDVFDGELSVLRQDTGQYYISLEARGPNRAGLSVLWNSIRVGTIQPTTVFGEERKATQSERIADLEDALHQSQVELAAAENKLGYSEHLLAEARRRLDWYMGSMMGVRECLEGIIRSKSPLCLRATVRNALLGIGMTTAIDDSRMTGAKGGLKTT